VFKIDPITTFIEWNTRMCVCVCVCVCVRAFVYCELQMPEVN